MTIRIPCILSLLLIGAGGLALSETPKDTGSSSEDLAKLLGISFPSNSQSTVVLTRDGKQYLIDVATKTVKEVRAAMAESSEPASDKDRQMAAALFAKDCAACHGPDGKGNKSIGTLNFTDPALQKTVSVSEMQTAVEKGKGGIMPAWSGKLTEEQISSLVTYLRSLAPGSDGGAATGTSTSSSAPGPSETQPKPDIYQPGDDVLVSLPTGKPTDKHGVYVNFAHRFPYQPAFTGPNEGATLFGLDNIAIPSFGFRYGVTANLSLSVFRAPLLVN